MARYVWIVYGRPASSDGRWCRATTWLSRDHAESWIEQFHLANPGLFELYVQKTIQFAFEL